MNKNLVTLVLCLSCFLLPAQAATIHLTANLDCAQAEAGAGTCAAGGSGTGVGNMTFDTETNLLSWELSYSGLSSAVFAAHFHGPALPNQIAGIQVNVGTQNPAIGSSVITPAQATDLLAGRWYINVHSNNFVDGEIRAQVRAAPICDIQLNQSSYVDGDSVTIEVFRLANLSAADIATEIKVWLGIPGVAPISTTNAGADGSLPFSAGLDIDLGPFLFFPVSAALPRGSYEFSCRLLDPVTGELLAEDRNFFELTTPTQLPAPELPGQLVITEVMINPAAVPDAAGEWFEIYNPTATAFDLQDLVISDDGIDSFPIDTSLIIPANGFVVLGVNADPVTNGGVNLDFQYSNFTLTNVGDEIEISNGPVVIDRIAYAPGTFIVSPGQATALDPRFFDAVSNDNGRNWCVATSPLAQGDFGTPGALNADDCF